MALGKKKESKPKKQKKKIGNELPDSLKMHNIRVSSPYGAYPEDVDRILTSLNTSISQLEKEIKRASEERDTYKSQKEALQTELTKLKMQVSLMEIPDTSSEEDFEMSSRLENINPNVGNRPEPTPPARNKETMVMEKIEQSEQETENKQSNSNLFGLEIIDS